MSTCFRVNNVRSIDLNDSIDCVLQSLVDQLTSENHPAPPPSTPEDASQAAESPVEPDQKTDVTGSQTTKEETLLAINLLAQFFFREVQHNGLARRFLLRRINKEMNEGLEKGGPTVNKIIKGLKVRNNAHSVIVNS